MVKHSWWNPATQTAEAQFTPGPSEDLNSRKHRRQRREFDPSSPPPPPMGLIDRRDGRPDVSVASRFAVCRREELRGGGGCSSKRLLRLDEEMPSVSGSVSGFEPGSPIGRKDVESTCLVRGRDGIHTSKLRVSKATTTDSPKFGSDWIKITTIGRYRSFGIRRINVSTDKQNPIDHEEKEQVIN